MVKPGKYSAKLVVLKNVNTQKIFDLSGHCKVWLTQQVIDLLIIVKNDYTKNIWHLVNGLHAEFIRLT